MKSKVTLVRCEDYDKVDKAVEQAIGNISEFIKKDEKVLIKVNLLQRKTAEEAVTTHPAVLEAVIRVIKKQTSNITVGDSPALGKIERIAEKAGILDVCKRQNVALSDLGEGIIVKNPKGNIKRFTICGEVLKFDKIVNISKLKTHSLTIMTNATKNLFGFIPGMLKPQSHLKFQDANRFSDMLIDLGLLINPCLNITDGVIAMEGQGPASGTPKRVNLIMASSDHIAIDVVAAEITGLKVPLVDIAKKRNLIPEIEVKGNIDEFKTKFKSPVQGSNRAIDFIAGVLRKIFVSKPVLITDKCIKCKACYNICPAKAINMRPYPVFDYKKCIRCYCCHEYCPESAIKLKRLT